MTPLERLARSFAIGALAPAAAGVACAAPEALPGIRIDVEARTVEFDGVVPIDAHNEETPHVYLELFICTPDTREHESLVMSSVLPSHIHAALLAIGLEPGRPGAWRWEGEEVARIPPDGDPVTIEFIWRDAAGEEHTDAPRSWVEHAATGEPIPDGSFVFAGSRFVVRQGGERYDADGAGTTVGLTTFGSETIAWSAVISPDAGTDEPVWIASGRTPPAGTAVTVRIRPAAED